jgi:transcriptional regulator with XRE-family HTH domain
MMDTKGIGGRIQKLRRTNGLTQEQVAEAVDISVNYLSNIETGRDICSTVVLLNIANLLNASIDYILGDNLNYSRKSEMTGQYHVDLLHQIALLNENECAHLLKYIALMKESNS